jgi:DNA-binding transcriptional LysR family regulator
LDASELRKAPFIDDYRKSQLIASWTRHHFGRKFRELNIVMHAAHSELVVQLILQGVGIGIVASSIAAPYVDVGRLFVIRGREKQLKSTIWLKRREAAKHDRAQALFQKRLITHLQASISCVIPVDLKAIIQRTQQIP